MADRRLSLLVFGTALGALFLSLAVRSLDWHASAAALSRARLADIGVVLACLFAFYALKAWRWRYVIAPFARAKRAVSGSIRLPCSIERTPCSRQRRIASAL